MEVDKQQSEPHLDLGHREKAKQAAPAGSGELLFDEDRLRIYYDKVFPFKLMFKWMSYGKLNTNSRALASLDEGISSSYFHNREFSFTLANDVYCRYLCFKTAEQFKETLVDRCPFKIDMGAVYNIPPDRHNASDKRAFVPLQKEMVFDIDMNDYDDVRRCCTGAKVCDKCWQFLKIAMLVLNKILAEDFDFDNVLWVFSGRRGLHAWICDEGAREMTNEMRSAVVGYCNLGVGNEMTGRTNLASPLHPRLRDMFRMLSPMFESLIIKEQQLLQVETHRERFLQYCFDDTMKAQVRSAWKAIGDDPQDSEALWAVWNDYYKDAALRSKKQGFRGGYDLCREALIFTYLYPRLDANVSTGINHLLKSPWCVHPKTGKICVPLDPKNPDDFKVDEVPTLTQVINELGASKNTNREEGDSITPACLAGPMTTFKAFLKSCEGKRIKEIQASSKNIKKSEGTSNNVDF